MRLLPLQRATATLLFLFIFLPLSHIYVTRASQREHLTPMEVEQVRDNQELTKRTEVFIKAAERRMLTLTNRVAAEAQAQNEAESELWGELTKSTRPQLLSDIARILDEAVTNIDDVAERSPTSLHLTKSLKKLADASTRFLPELSALRDRIENEDERALLERAIENAQEIIAASARHPVVEEKKKKK